MLRNTDGKKDAVLTMAAVAMAVVLVKILLSGLSLTIKGTIITFGTIDSALVGALLTPTLGAYVARRYTEKKFNVDLNNNGKIDPEEKSP